MFFPYGEWLLFFLVIISWSEGYPMRRWLYALSLAWLTGKALEFMIFTGQPWHFAYSRFAVMIIFLVWGWQKTKHRFVPILLTSLLLITQDLFLVNEPGIFHLQNWLFAGMLLLVAWLSTLSFWGMAVALAGGILINQGFIPFFYGGIVSHMDLPDPFLWNFMVISVCLLGLLKTWLGKLKSSKFECEKVPGLCFDNIPLRFQDKSEILDENKD